jgi:hypothetical protein
VSEFVVRLPNQFDRIVLSDLNENLGRVAYEKRPDAIVGKTAGSWRAGRQMTTMELEPYQAGGFRCVGWRATQMKSGDRMGVMLSLANVA